MRASRGFHGHGTSVSMRDARPLKHAFAGVWARRVTSHGCAACCWLAAARTHWFRGGRVRVRVWPHRQFCFWGMGSDLAGLLCFEFCDGSRFACASRAWAFGPSGGDLIP
eukprot:6341153-Prymnesium_polylepis.1